MDVDYRQPIFGVSSWDKLTMLGFPICSDETAITIFIEADYSVLTSYTRYAVVPLVSLLRRNFKEIYAITAQTRNVTYRYGLEIRSLYKSGYSVLTSTFFNQIGLIGYPF